MGIEPKSEAWVASNDWPSSFSTHHRAHSTNRFLFSLTIDPLIALST
jgi:hypothetical protein